MVKVLYARLGVKSLNSLLPFSMLILFRHAISRIFDRTQCGRACQWPTDRKHCLSLKLGEFWKVWNQPKTLKTLLARHCRERRASLPKRFHWISVTEIFARASYFRFEGIHKTIHRYWHRSIFASSDDWGHKIESFETLRLTSSSLANLKLVISSIGLATGLVWSIAWSIWWAS